MFISAILIGATTLASVSAISLMSKDSKPINNTVNNITNNINDNSRIVNNQNTYNNDYKVDNRVDNSFKITKEEIDKDALINNIKDIFREQDMKARMKELDDRINKCK